MHVTALRLLELSFRILELFPLCLSSPPVDRPKYYLIRVPPSPLRFHGTSLFAPALPLSLWTWLIYLRNSVFEERRFARDCKSAVNFLTTPSPSSHLSPSLTWAVPLQGPPRQTGKCHRMMRTHSWHQSDGDVFTNSSSMLSSLRSGNAILDPETMHPPNLDSYLSMMATNSC